MTREPRSYSPAAPMRARATQRQPPTQAVLLERVAWAHARAGELTQTERALDAVDRAFERRRPEEDPRWVYWLDRDDIDVMAGRCYTELRRHAEAEPLLFARSSRAARPTATLGGLGIE